MKNGMFGLLLLLGACATVTPEQRAAAQKIRIITGDPPPGCDDLGSVSGGSYMGDEEAVREGLRLEAARKGADVVRLDGARPGYAVGTAFRCPVESTGTK
jgi:hypothetical protein